MWQNGGFAKKSASVTFSPYGPHTSYKKSEKSNEKFLRKIVTNQVPTTNICEYIGPARCGGGPICKKLPSENEQTLARTLVSEVRWTS